MLKFIVIEYFPHRMGRAPTGHGLLRVDGHYARQEAAEGVAALWAESPTHEESRVAVFEVVHVAKDPAHWKARDE